MSLVRFRDRAPLFKKADHLTMFGFFIACDLSHYSCGFTILIRIIRLPILINPQILAFIGCEEALLSCMAYVDLNPVRANMATTPEASEHTSIKERLSPQLDLESAVKLQIKQQCLQNSFISSECVAKPLATFEGNVNQKDQLGILFSFEDYLELVDSTGRLLLPHKKRGNIEGTLPPILQRLNLDQKTWLEQATKFETCYQTQFAKPKSLKKPQAA